MKKSKLKTGMIVRVADDIGVIIKNCSYMEDCVIGKGTFVWCRFLSEFDSDLNFEDPIMRKEFGGISAVYEPIDISCGNAVVQTALLQGAIISGLVKRIWERDSKVELTLSQIAEKFNIAVSNLRVKN